MKHWLTRDCVVCNREFTPSRRDTLYCSKACKQVAYRNRGGAASKGVTVTATAEQVAPRPFMERRK